MQRMKKIYFLSVMLFVSLCVNAQDKKWDVEKYMGPTKNFSISTDEGTWMNLDVSPDGKEIAFDRKKGNCLACHKIAGGTLAGTIGPELVGMKDRYPDKAPLRAQIYDPRTNNPVSIMPPFGKHEVISSSELDKVVDFIQSL